LASIACDTDFLIKITNDPLPKFDTSLLLSENELVIIPQVLREISGLESSKSPTTSRRARLVKRVMAERKIFKLLSEGEATSSVDADNALLEFVKTSPSTRAIATLDGSLLKRLEKMGLPYLTLSNGKMLGRFKQRARYLTANKDMIP
jgi:rRNA-processing protein FCF1